MPAQASTFPRRPSRLRLYGPFLLLGALAVAWSVGWFVMRDRVVAGLDQWVAAEAAVGRQWSCPDRTVGGYPFRIELACSSLSLRRPDVVAQLGRLLVVAQIHNPSHLIAEAAGPLKVTTAAGDDVTGEWELLQASVVTTGARRAAIVARAPRVRIVAPGTGTVDLSAGQLETHLRPDPSDPTTADFALTASAAIVPGLDGMIGGTEPTDIDLVATVSQAHDLPARPLWGELERWRAAGGQVAFQRLSLAKGPRRIAGKGTLAVDEQHRPRAQLDLAAVGLEGVLGGLIGGKGGLAGNLLGALLGASSPAEIRQPQAGASSGGPPLRPLPTVRIEGGRLFLGPLPIPGVRIPALY
ncbi:MAG: hypothetical protein JWR08_646 [Enterovirga sp.]|nr:hypothetical protein [Enterovirga sp.]